MINAIIMASGLAKRMGENKLLLDFNGIPVIEHIFKVVKEIEFQEVIVISCYDEILDLGRKYNYKCIYNYNSIVGQSESIKLGISHCKECDGFMFFVGDQPFIDKSSINKIINTFNIDNSYIVVPKSNTKKGNPVIFPYDKKTIY